MYESSLFFIFLQMLYLYLETLIICHERYKMLRTLHKIPLHRKWQCLTINNGLGSTSKQQKQPHIKANIKPLVNVGPELRANRGN